LLDNALLGTPFNIWWWR